MRKRLADLERNTKGEELGKEKYKMLIETETKIVKHFRFNLAADSSSFGKSQFVSIKVFFWQSKFITFFLISKMNMSITRRGVTTLNAPIG